MKETKKNETNYNKRKLTVELQNKRTSPVNHKVYM